MTWDASFVADMQSVTETLAESVSNVVSRVSVLPRYRRAACTTGWPGAMIHRPCSASPRRAAKQAALSNLGRQSQSIDPSRPTSATVSQLPMMA